jgi:hypothetical protein
MFNFKQHVFTIREINHHSRPYYEDPHANHLDGSSLEDHLPVVVA